MTTLSGLKQDERGRFYRLLRGHNGAPILRYCPEPVQLRFVGKFNPRPGEQRIRLERFDGAQWQVVP
jgi:hypothetical protein